MQARTLLFTIYGDFVLRYGQEVWIGSLIQALAQFGLQAPAVRMAVSRSVQDGLLEALPSGQKGYYTLTEKGRHRIQEGSRRVYRQVPEVWNGHWRVVTFAIPEDRRELRERIPAELEWRGFGKITPNTWISPHHHEEAIQTFIEEFGLQGHLHHFLARYSGPVADRELAARCWDLPRLAARYTEFNTEVEARIRAMREEMASGREIPDSRCFVERVWLVHEWRRFLHFDPDLPAELLPQDWPGALPRQLFWEYYRMLSAGAERFFLDLNRQAAGAGSRRAVAAKRAE